LKINTVDEFEFVKTKVLPQYQEIVKMLRELMKECAPNEKEVISYRIPFYKENKMFAVISPTEKD